MSTLKNDGGLSNWLNERAAIEGGVREAVKIAIRRHEEQHECLPRMHELLDKIMIGIKPFLAAVNAETELRECGNPSAEKAFDPTKPGMHHIVHPEDTPTMSPEMDAWKARHERQGEKLTLTQDRATGCWLDSSANIWFNSDTEMAVYRATQTELTALRDQLAKAKAELKQRARLGEGFVSKALGRDIDLVTKLAAVERERDEAKARLQAVSFELDASVKPELEANKADNIRLSQWKWDAEIELDEEKRKTIDLESRLATSELMREALVAMLGVLAAEDSQCDIGFVKLKEDARKLLAAHQSAVAAQPPKLATGKEGA